ncbi:hypothetical protein [Paracoccus sp. N5]|nr:hypothetical protein [Paracoccus sp. N5]
MAFVMSLRTIRMFAMVILGPTLATGLARMLLHRRGGRP